MNKAKRILAACAAIAISAGVLSAPATAMPMKQHHKMMMMHKGKMMHHKHMMMKHKRMMHRSM